MKNTDPTFVPFLRNICKENEEAVAFLVLITNLAHFWDDVIDADPAPSKAVMHEGMWACLVDLPRDPFYKRYFPELNPLMANAILDWRVANRLEAGEPATSHRRISFIIRSSYVCILQQTALIVGGPEWAEVCGLAIRVKCHAEGFDAYLKSLGGSDGNV